MKKLIDLSFEEKEDLNKFVNKNKIPREDVVNIESHWNFGLYNFVLSFYADKTLDHAIKHQEKKNEKSERKTRITLLIVFAVLFGLLGLLWFLVRNRPMYVS